MAMVRVRKQYAGGDSFGHVWAEDGAVVEMPYEQAMELLAIPDAGCSIADDDDAAEVTEPAPAPDSPVSEAPKPRRGRPPKKAVATAEGDADKTVEE